MRIFIISFLLLFTFCAVAQDYSTRGEIYDYEVGDEFHYEETIYDHLYWLFRDINMEIVDKTVSPAGDTITYLQFYKMYTILTDASSGYDEYYETLTIINPDQDFIVDSVYYSDIYNGRKVSHSNNSYSLVEEITEHVDGCGQSKYFFRDMTGFPYEWFINLVYFKKGNEEWGTPNPVVGIEDQQQHENAFVIYPNPTRNILHLSSTERIIEIQIYDQAGRQVISRFINEYNIDVSILERGFYILTIITEKGQTSKKFLKH